jgi:hypothetical protein
MADRAELRLWQQSNHKNTAINLWKTESCDQLQALLVNEMKTFYYVNTVFPNRLKYTDKYEQANSINAALNGRTQYKEDDVNYAINNYGFRGKWELGDQSKPSMAAFGCSFTFGIGIADQDLFINRLAARFKCRAFNFGVPGGSIGKATRYYALSSEYHHFDYVIFLLPQVGRIELPNTSDKYSPTWDVIPNWTSTHAPDDRRRKALYTALDDNFFEYLALANINTCIQIAKRHGTRIFFSSWDPPTYDLIYDYLGKDSRYLLPWFELANTETTMARDGLHSGPDSHKRFFEKSVAYLLK